MNLSDVLAPFAASDLAALADDGWTFRPVAAPVGCLACKAPAVGAVHDPGFGVEVYCGSHLAAEVRAHVEALEMGCF